MTRTCILATIAAACFIVGGPTTAADKDARFDDTDFIKKAASAGMLEVELGKLGQTKGTRDEVKTFGERMVTDHTKANTELMTVATAMGVTVPKSMSDKHQKMYSHFKNYNGKNFDKDYMDHMVKDHDEDVAEFKKASQSAKNADLKAFATKTLPVIEEHLKMAKDIQSSIKK
ncbi:MAG: DUF4142 domain-containing protein [Gemmataceae bacterium]